MSLPTSVALLMILGSEAYKGTYSPERYHSIECRLAELSKRSGWMDETEGVSFVPYTEADARGLSSRADRAEEIMDRILENLDNLQCTAN